jgi:acyl-phosphate glycerol 3-phosphate acyltransferase
MNQPAILVLVVVAAYLFGAIPFGYLVARWRGIDIRQAGSGNIGATNVWRVLGARYGLLVFVLDFAKGAIPVLAAKQIAALDGQSTGTGWGSAGFEVAAGLAAFLGHLFPIYLRLHGGKGVATGAGVVAVLLPIPTLAAVFTWIAVLAATRYVSFSSMMAAVALCAAHFARTDRPLAPANRPLTLFCLTAAVLVFIRHRSNVVRLIKGNENRLGENRTMLLFTKVIHVLAVGLWFGSMVFFILGTLSIFETFQHLAASEADRPSWLSAVDNFNPEKATQLAGIVVSPLFDWYFPLQASCAVLALATALGWTRLENAWRLDRARFRVLFIAAATIALGWPLARHVNQLRLDRYASDPAVAGFAREAFGTWHTYSLLLNMATLVLVTVAMALAAALPAPPKVLDAR